MRRIGFAVLGLMGLSLLTACAKEWIKPGATEKDLEIAKTACEQRAGEIFPPHPNPRYVSPGYIKDGRYVPPIIVITDENSGRRAYETDTCLTRQGWKGAED